MSLRVVKLTEDNIGIFYGRIHESLLQEYRNTYNIKATNDIYSSIKDECLSYMYVLVYQRHNSINQHLIGYFSLSNYDRSKSYNLFTACYDYLKRNVYIFDVFIYPKYRKIGVGTYMIKEAIKLAASDLKAKKLLLYTVSKELTKFYRKTGFCIVDSCYSDDKLFYLHEKRLDN